MPIIHSIAHRNHLEIKVENTNKGLKMGVKYWRLNILHFQTVPIALFDNIDFLDAYIFDEHVENANN